MTTEDKTTEPTGLPAAAEAPPAQPCPPPPPSPISIIVDCVVLIGIFALLGLGKITPEAGLPWLAVILAARLKPAVSGGGVATLGAWMIADKLR